VHEDRSDDVTEREIPNVDETGITRDEMEVVADDLGVDPEGLDDQELLEELGVALGELDPDDLESASASGAGDENDEDDAVSGEQTAVGEPIEGPTRDELREELRERDLPVSGTKEELEERLADADD
jgi:hypothetical protein